MQTYVIHDAMSALLILFSHLGKAYHSSSMSIDFKGDVDLVTSVDREVEALVINSLKEKCPTFLFLAEESAAAKGV
tara:strand:- start:106 stop:333 length:228 start_codon:yes stop_codon:yes gene_type:complete